MYNQVSIPHKHASYEGDAATRMVWPTNRGGRVMDALSRNPGPQTTVPTTPSMSPNVPSWSQPSLPPAKTHTPNPKS